MVFWGQFMVIFGLKCLLFLWHQHQLNLYSFEQIRQYWSIKLYVLYAPIALYFDIYDWILTKLLPQNCMHWVLLWGEMPIFIDFYSFHPFLKSVFYFRVRAPKLTFGALFGIKLIGQWHFPLYQDCLATNKLHRRVKHILLASVAKQSFN